jgi:protein dithiol:quinone oxidoreductase
MIKQLWNTLSITQAFALLALGCTGLLGFGMYLQHVVGLEPCPMCIVQRYAMTLIGVVALLGLVWRSVLGGRVLAVLAVLLAAGGAFVAARQTWLQWYPPEVASCGRDFYGMIESFPLATRHPAYFSGQWRLQQSGLDVFRRLDCQLEFRGLCRHGLVVVGDALHQAAHSDCSD